MSVEMYFEVNGRCCSHGKGWGQSWRPVPPELMSRY